MSLSHAHFVRLEQEVGVRVRVTGRQPWIGVTLQPYVDVVKKEFNFNLDKVHVHEPNIKLGDLSERIHCEKCSFYNKKDVFEHLDVVIMLNFRVCT